jgi:hypothetical protein
MGWRGRAAATWVESLVMPGEVVDAHADFETTCASCHAPFDKSAQNRLCRECHKQIAADLEQRQGFHGRAPGVAGTPCKRCHTEHKGRAADIVRLDPETFAHALTDFPLRGAHVRARCDACHAAGVPPREASSRCVGCHGTEDPHEGTLGSDCATCHGEDNWHADGFDHAATAFALKGKHRLVACESCHPTRRYRPTARECNACHAADDAHGGRFGVRCETCHRSDDWRLTSFDHAQTPFPLVGRHEAVPCEKCHAGPEPARTTCQGCHASNDAHHGRFGPRCQSCHTPIGWATQTFDHDRDTTFPLHGEHRSARCNDCHTAALYDRKLDTACYACHRADDVHNGQQGVACDTCHTERGWRRDVFFEHDLARFPLLGAHARVPCEECHASRAFKDTSRECVSCHATDDVHRGGLGGNCADCHHPTDWKLWTFDHDAQTDFRLDGAHRRLACRACHRDAKTTPLLRECASCHFTDDVHRGQFGRACEQCHVADSFRLIQHLR